MSKRQIIALNNIVLLVIEVASASACVSIMSFVTTAMASSEMSQNGKHLRRLSDNNSVHKFRGNGPFADGTETFYYDFSLAWRFLGFYTDCNVCIGDDDDDNDDNNNDNNNNGGEEYFVAPSECLENGEDRTVCRRYAMWAAYVDEAYEGKGPSEYQHFDHRTKRWDRSACSRNGGRCAKLDCHNPSSQNFELVGVFKDPQTDAFINSMIDYQGDCVWNDDEYKFMKAMTSNNNDNNEENNNSWFPTKCTAYEIDGEHDRIYSGYYDALPTSKGNMGVALYTDSSCTMPYQGKDHSAQEVMARSLGSSSSALEEKFDSWNEAMDAFKICQPCVAYKTLSNDSKTPYNADGDRYEQENGNSEEEQGNENENAFVCGNNLERDEPVNQCKVFAEQGSGSMMVATYRDILLAESQGTVTGIDLSPSSGNRRGKMVMGSSFVQPKHMWLSMFLFLMSIVFFGYALAQLFEKDRSKHGSNSKQMKKPLMGEEDTRKAEEKERKKQQQHEKQREQQQKLEERKRLKEEKRLEKKEQELRRAPKKSILKKSKNEEDSSNYSAFSAASSYNSLE